nr:hypothetical protein Iba_chr03aCG1110 [Ipomoea batatas]
MTSEDNCIIEDVDNACVEMSSDEIGVKEHDNFCDEPYDDSFDHNCGDAYIENVVGNVDCVVDNVHANLLENVGDINAKRDDDICDNSSNACKNATYDLRNNALKCGNDFWVDNEVNFLNPYDFNDSDSFDSSDDDDGNCVDTCENNSFNSNDDDGLESFTFDDKSLLNEHVGELHDMLCDVDDELNVDASLLDLNDIEFDTFHDNCLDDAIYIHDLLGEEKEGTNGDLRDVLLSREKEEEKESVTIEKENEEENFENKNVLFEEVHCKIIEEKKTRNESVREKVEEKVRNDEKEFGRWKMQFAWISAISSSITASSTRSSLISCFITVLTQSASAAREVENEDEELMREWRRTGIVDGRQSPYHDSAASSCGGAHFGVKRCAMSLSFVGIMA